MKWTVVALVAAGGLGAAATVIGTSGAGSSTAPPAPLPSISGSLDVVLNASPALPPPPGDAQVGGGAPAPAQDGGGGSVADPSAADPPPADGGPAATPTDAVPGVLSGSE